MPAFQRMVASFSVSVPRHFFFHALHNSSFYILNRPRQSLCTINTIKKKKKRKNASQIKWNKNKRMRENWIIFSFHLFVSLTISLSPSLQYSKFVDSLHSFEILWIHKFSDECTIFIKKITRFASFRAIKSRMFCN